MSLDFPDAPYPGQIYGQWSWTGSSWVSSLLGSGTYPVGGVLFGLADGNAGSDPDNLLFNLDTSSLAIGGTLSLGTPLAIANGGTAAITAAQALSNLGGLAKAGGVMSGTLTLFGSPSADLDAATKYYVDNAPNRTITLSGAVSGSGTNTIVTALATVPVASGGTGATTAAAALTNLGALPLAGGTLTGVLNIFNGAAGYGGQFAIGNTAAGATNINKTFRLSPTGSLQILNSAANDVPYEFTDAGVFIINASASSALYLNNPTTAYTNSIYGQRGRGNRWELQLGAAGPESGGNAASDFTLSRYSDAGAYLATAVLVQRSSGGCFNTTGVWQTLSDRELKQEIEPYNRGLSAITALNPVAFRYQKGTPFASKDEPSAVLYGLVAQDVEPIIPEVCGVATVFLDDQQREVATLEGGNLIYAMINAIKELKTELDELRAALPPGIAPLPAPH